MVVTIAEFIACDAFEKLCYKYLKYVLVIPCNRLK